jgi:hypothetical protein
LKYDCREKSKHNNQLPVGGRRRGMVGSPYQQIGQMKKYLELEYFQHSSEILSLGRLRLWNLPDVKTNLKNIDFFKCFVIDIQHWN